MTGRSQLPLSGLRAFEVFGRHKRMVTAAEELCVTHGAISRQIRQLQGALGVALIEGPKNQLRLTQAGTRLSRALTESFDAMTSAIEEVRPIEERGLKVSCLGTFAMRWLIPRLPQFYRAYPAYSVVISESWAPIEFSDSEFDAAIRMGAPGTNGSTVFMREFHGPVVATALVDERFDAKAIGTSPRLSTRTHPHAWAEWETNTSRLAGEPASNTFFDHTYYMLAAANAGLGVAIGTWALVEPDIRAGHLLAPHGFVPANNHYLLHTNPRSRHPAIEAFRSWLVEEGGRFSPPQQISTR